MLKNNDILLTTLDIKGDYDILGPVYFQVNNGGNQFGILKQKYTKLVKDLENSGQRSNDATSGLEVMGAVTNILSILGGGPQDRDLIGNSHENFDIAFFIACEELKERARILGADAIIGMRQDLDLDTNGFQHFYLQVYGTAVKFITSKEIEECGTQSQRIIKAKEKEYLENKLAKERAKEEERIKKEALRKELSERDLAIVMKPIIVDENNIMCPNCRAIQRSDRNICFSCSQKFMNGNEIPYWCANCGENGPYDDVCPKCGSKEKIINENIK